MKPIHHFSRYLAVQIDRDKSGLNTFSLAAVKIEKNIWFLHLIRKVLWHCWLGDRKDTQPVKNWILVCCWWQLEWSLACFTVPVATINSIILSSDKIHNGDNLVTANPGPPGKWPLKPRESSVTSVLVVGWRWRFRAEVQSKSHLIYEIFHLTDIPQTFLNTLTLRPHQQHIAI